MAASSNNPNVDKIKVLLETDVDNCADINSVDSDGLTTFHVILARLIDLGSVESQIVEALGERLQLLGILHERLHLLLAPHRAEEAENAVNRRRNG